MSTQVPLSSLAQKAKADCHTPKVECAPKADCHTKYAHGGHVESHKHVEHVEHHTGNAGYIGWAVLIFIILAVIIWFILAAWKPTWVQCQDAQGNPTGELDNGKAIIWALAIAFIILIIIAILRMLAGGYAC